jgi:hypothetical protein
MLIYALYVAALIMVLAALWYGWHRLARGRRPPEVADDTKGPPPADRDERWDPRRRYDDPEEHRA